MGRRRGRARRLHSRVGEPRPAASATSAGTTTAAQYVKVGYFTQWGICHRNFLVKNLHTSGMAAKLTHINYAFANVGADGRCFEANGAGVGDAWADYQKRFKSGEAFDGVADVVSQPLAGNFHQLLKLKTMYRSRSVSVSARGIWSLPLPADGPRLTRVSGAG